MDFAMFPIGILILSFSFIHPSPLETINKLKLPQNEITQRIYNVTEYNCVNFSQDMQKDLNLKNITTIKLEVDSNLSDNISHEIIAILIEPQSGETIPIGTYKTIKIDEEFNDTTTT
jgi:hypothetical protein